MALELNGTTGVSLVQDGVVTAADLASTLDLTGKTVTLPAGTGGKVLQVVYSESTATVTNSSGTPTQLLAASITPSSASNKIFVLATGSLEITTSSNSYASWWLYRGTTSGTQIQRTIWGIGSNIAAYGTTTGTVLDSPATTSSQTYTFAMARGSSGTTSVSTDGSKYTLTLMEIAA